LIAAIALSVEEAGRHVDLGPMVDLVWGLAGHDELLASAKQDGGRYAVGTIPVSVIESNDSNARHKRFFLGHL